MKYFDREHSPEDQRID